MTYGWGTNEPVIKPIEEGGDNINQYALKIKEALDALYVELRQDIVRATLAEAIAGTDIKKIITPSTSFRTYYGEGEPGNLQGKNGDTYIRYGDIKDTYIKASGAWQKIDAVPQPASVDETNGGVINTKYVTPYSLYNGGFTRVDENGLLPWQCLPGRVSAWTTPGEYEWTCPENVNTVFAFGSGGGGGGGGGCTVGYDRKVGNGAGGGAGGTVLSYPLRVTPGDTYVVTIGQGGAPGTGGNSNGAKGGDTMLGYLLTLVGGGGGTGGNTGDYVNCPGGAAGDSPLLLLPLATAGQTTVWGEYYTNSDGGTSSYQISKLLKEGGHGGSTIWGKGGVWYRTGPDSSTGVSQAGQGYGAGGSGGYRYGASAVGGAGHDGFLALIY